MGLISVDRKPTLLGGVTDYVTPLLTTAATPAVWDFRASNQFKDVTGALLPTGLRVYGVTVANESGTDLQVAFDSVLTSDNPAYDSSSPGAILPAYGTRYFDVSTLLGVVGVRRVLLASLYVASGNVLASRIGRSQTSRYTLTATFYTEQQSA